MNEDIRCANGCFSQHKELKYLFSPYLNQQTPLCLAKDQFWSWCKPRSLWISRAPAGVTPAGRCVCVLGSVLGLVSVLGSAWSAPQWDQSWAPAGPAGDKKAPPAHRERSQLCPSTTQAAPDKHLGGWGGAAQLGKLHTVPGAEFTRPGVHMELMGGPKSGLILVQHWEITWGTHREPQCGSAHPSLSASAVPALGDSHSPAF